LRRVVTPGYFKTVGIPLRAGRDLAPTDRQGTPPVTVIDELLARKFFPGENPIGQHLMVTAMTPADTLATPRDFEVVGVVGSARLNSVGSAPYPTAYMSSNQFGMGRVNLMLRSRMEPAALSRTVARLIRERHPDLAVDALVSMDDVVSEALLAPRVTATTLAIFSAVALLLAALGLYGVLVFYVTQRGHEIGVRMALGAGTAAILRQVLARSALMVGPGLAVGLLASMAAGRLLRGLLYQVEPTDAATYAVVSLALASVAFAASAWPAMRAARVSPVQALRGE
jgi:putative ABC transport system permease protein